VRGKRTDHHLYLSILLRAGRARGPQHRAAADVQPTLSRVTPRYFCGTKRLWKPKHAGVAYVSRATALWPMCVINARAARMSPALFDLATSGKAGRRACRRASLWAGPRADRTGCGAGATPALRSKPRILPLARAPYKWFASSWRVKNRHCASLSN